MGGIVAVDKSQSREIDLTFEKAYWKIMKTKLKTFFMKK